MMPLAIRRSFALTVGVLICASGWFSGAARAAETIWIEAENLQGVHGYCFPDMDQKTAGHWALSGPGLAPEWTQGGESEWLSIACAPDDAAAAATTTVEVPEGGEWRIWVRYVIGVARRNCSRCGWNKPGPPPRKSHTARNRSSMTTMS